MRPSLLVLVGEAEGVPLFAVSKEMDPLSVVYRQLGGGVYQMYRELTK